MSYRSAHCDIWRHENCKEEECTCFCHELCDCEKPIGADLSKTVELEGVLYHEDCYRRLFR